MKRKILILSLLLLASCSGKRDVEGINYNFSSAHVLIKGDRKVYLNETNKDLDLASIHDDYDLDNIPDLMDEDIDNDGVINYADEYPYDKEKKNVDIDADGISDFIDFEVQGIYKTGYSEKHKKLQEKFLTKRNILIISVDRVLKQKEIDALNTEFFENSLSHFKSFPNLKVIYKSPEDLYDTKFAEYNNFWNTIVLYQNAYFEQDQFNFNNSLVHEVFHSIQKSHSDLYNDFLKIVGWEYEGRGFSYKGKYYSRFEMKNDPVDLINDLSSENFPSDYSKLGPEEMFAECGTAFNFLNKSNRTNFDIEKYNQMDNFNRSDAYNFFSSYFNFEK